MWPGAGGSVHRHQVHVRSLSGGDGYFLWVWSEVRSGNSLLPLRGQASPPTPSHGERMPSGRAQTNSCIQPEDIHPCTVEDQDIEHPLLINACLPNTVISLHHIHTVCVACLELISCQIGLEL